MDHTSKPYHVDATKDEKLRELFNDRRNTFHNRASAELDLENSSGRFAKPAAVIGETPAVHYPQLPTSSPWHDNPVDVEPPYDGDMSTPIVGEAWEVKKSLGKGNLSDQLQSDDVVKGAPEDSGPASAHPRGAPNILDDAITSRAAKGCDQPERAAVASSSPPKVRGV